MSSPPLAGPPVSAPPAAGMPPLTGQPGEPSPWSSPPPSAPPPSGPPPSGWPAPRAGVRLVTLASGLAVALSSTALSGVLRGDRWLWYVLASVGLVVAIGLLARAVRVPAVVVPVVQLAGLVPLLTGLFSTEPVLRVLPGTAALTELGEALAASVHQIEGGVPPVPTTMAIALLVSVGFGVVAVGVDALASAGHAPAACGLVLLGAYTVPTALAPRALSDWSLAAGAFGYMVVLLAEHRRRQARRGIPAAPAVRPRRGLPGPARRALDRMRRSVPAGGGTALAALLTAVALGAGLGVGALASAVGTHGRFAGGGHSDSGATDGQFGLNPFTSLRGQLENDSPVELLRVRGLPAAQYLRAVTLTRYVPQQGWQLPDRYADVTVDRSLPSGMATPVNNPTATVTIENDGYLDQWLPLYGLPMGVTGVVPGRWRYDVLTNTAYTDLPVHEPSWTERTGLPDPSVSALEQSPPATDVNPTFLETGGVDPRIVALARAVTRRAPSPFLRAVALNQYFLDPRFGFRYSLKTRPGNTGDQLVDFLTRGKTGYCEQFASAMAVMLRTVGVPARVAVGFSAGKPVADYRSISTGDAHAWVEVYLAGFGWLPFDPTPLDDGRSARPNYLTNAPKVGIDVPPSVQAGQPGPDQPQPGADQPQPGADQPQAGADQPRGGPDDRQPGGSDERTDDQRPDEVPPTSPSPGSPPGEGNSASPPPGGDQAQGGNPGGSGDDQTGGRGAPGQGGAAGGSDGSAGPGGAGGSGEGGSGPGDTGTGGSGSGDDAGQWRVGGVLVGLRTALLTALALLTLVGLLLTPTALRRIARSRRLGQAARGGPDGAVAAWREVLAEFRDRGAEPPENNTVRSTARRLARGYRLDAEAIGAIKCVVRALERGWYAEQHDPDPTVDLAAAVNTVRSTLARTAPLPLTARLWPRSALPARLRRRNARPTTTDQPTQDRVLIGR
jgi:TgpA N-terminal domain/Transglutaminase-like superfamily